MYPFVEAMCQEAGVRAPSANQLYWLLHNLHHNQSTKQVLEGVAAWCAFGHVGYFVQVRLRYTYHMHTHPHAHGAPVTDFRSRRSCHGAHAHDNDTNVFAPVPPVGPLYGLQ